MIASAAMTATMTNATSPVRKTLYAQDVTVWNTKWPGMFSLIQSLSNAC